MIMVTTFQARQTVVKITISKDDEDMLALTSTVNNDLIAPEARYHRVLSCLYVSKTNLKVSGINEEKIDLQLIQVSEI